VNEYFIVAANISGEKMNEIKLNIEEKNNQSIFSDDENKNIIITDPLKDRYNTFGFISWWKQDIVRNARVLVIGAGALGNEVLKNLALMGVGNILVADYDIIEDSNLSRSVLYRAADKGCQKAEIAARAVTEINPDVSTQWLHVDINHDLGLGVYRRMDVIIGCLDNREARLTINKSCWRLDKPWIDGAIQELLGVARVFKPNSGACYECTLTDEDYKIMSVRMSCNRLAHENVIEGKVPTTPTISSIIAAIETQEALKLLHGMEVQTGQALVFNGLMNDVYTVEYPEKEGCMSHEIWKDDIVEVAHFTSEKTTASQLLDKAQKLLGPTAFVEIPGFVTEARCDKCSSQIMLNKPLHRLNFEEAHCVECGDLLNLITFDKLEKHIPFLSFTLGQIGFPPLEIIVARTPDWEAKYIELSGDADIFFDH
jgi:molybdopterin/thiamine biosynthesis adenylyltransferase